MANPTGSWSAYRNANYGPWLVGSTVYVLTVTTNTVTMHRSTDGGGSWSTSTQSLTGVVSASGAVSSTTIHVATMTGSAAARYTYDTTSHTWTSVASTAAVVAGTGVVHADVAPYSSGQAMIYQSATSSVMGTPYRRVSVIGTGVSATVLTANDQVHYDAFAAIAGASGRVHLFYTGLSGTTRTLRHRTLTSAGSLISEQNITTIDNVTYPVGRPWSDGTDVFVPYASLGGNLCVATATSADSPTWTTGIIVTFANDPESANANPAAITHDGTDWHSFWIDDAQTTIFRDKTASGSWGTDVAFLSGSAASPAYETLGATGAAIQGVGGIGEAFAESFPSPGNVPINGISLNVWRQGSPSDGLVVELVGGSEGGTVLATSDTIPASGIPGSSSASASWVYFPFSSPYTVSASTTYWLRVSRTGARDTSNYFFSTVVSPGGYASGTGYVLASGSWSAQSYDLSFRINGTSINGINIAHVGSGTIGVLYDNNGTVTYDTYGSGPVDGTATMTRDSLTVSGKAVTGTVAANASATMTRDQLTVSGKVVTATGARNETGTITRDTLSVSGKTLTATGQRNESATMTRDTLSVSGKALTATAGSGAVGTMTRDQLTVSGKTLTATGQRNESGTITRDALTVSGKAVTATATISASATLTADALTASGKVVTGSAESVVNATGTITAEAVAVTGRAVTATSGASATMTRDTLSVSGKSLTGQSGTLAAMSVDALTVVGKMVAATSGTSAILTPGSSTVTGQNLTATGQRNETATMARDQVSTSGKVLTGTASVTSSATIAPSTIVVSGQALSASGQRNETATVSPDTVAVVGKGVTAVADISSGAAITRDEIAFSGKDLSASSGTIASTTVGTMAFSGGIVTGSASVTIDAEATIDRSAIVIDGHGITGTAVATGAALVTADTLAVVGHSLAATGQRHEAATLASASISISGKSLSASGSVIIDATANIAAASRGVTGHSFLASGQRNESTTIGASGFTIVGQPLSADDEIVPITHFDSFVASAPSTERLAKAPVTLFTAREITDPARLATAPQTIFVAGSRDKVYASPAPNTAFVAED